MQAWMSAPLAEAHPHHGNTGGCVGSEFRWLGGARSAAVGDIATRVRSHSCMVLVQYTYYASCSAPKWATVMQAAVFPVLPCDCTSTM